MNERLRWVAAALVVSSSACLLPVTTENSPCPCSTGFECCAATQKCASAGRCGAGGGASGGGEGGGTVASGGAGGGSVIGGGTGGGTVIGGGTGANGPLAPLSVMSDGTLPVTGLLLGAQPPAQMALVGETVYVLARQADGCSSPGLLTTFRAAVSRVEFVDGGWVRSWTTTLPVEVTSTVFSMVASTDGVTVAGRGAFDGAIGRGGSEAFVVRVTPDGSVGWRHEFATIFDDDVNAMLQRRDGKVIVAGTTGGSVLGRTSQGGIDVFVGQLSADGGFDWFQQFGTPSDERAETLVPWDDNTFVLTGQTSGSLEPGAPQDATTFLRKYDSLGAEFFTRQNSLRGAVARWGSGLVVSDNQYGSFVARLAANGALEWQQALPADDTFGSDRVVHALDDDRLVIHGVRGLSGGGPGSFPRRELTEQLWSSDAGMTVTSGIGGGWPRSGEMLWTYAVSQQVDGRWYLAGSGTTSSSKTMFSVTAFAPVGGMRVANFDWRFIGPEFETVFPHDGPSTFLAQSINVTPTGAIVVLGSATLDGCDLNAGGVMALVRAQP